MRALRKRLERLEKLRPYRSELFDYWCRYGEAYQIALVKGGDKKAAIDELNEHLSPYWSYQVVAYCEWALTSYQAKKGDCDG